VGSRGTPGDWRGRREKKAQGHFRDGCVVTKTAGRKAEKERGGELWGRGRSSETESASGGQTPGDECREHPRIPRRTCSV